MASSLEELETKAGLQTKATWAFEGGCWAEFTNLSARATDDLHSPQRVSLVSRQAWILIGMRRYVQICLYTCILYRERERERKRRREYMYIHKEKERERERARYRATEIAMQMR